MESIETCNFILLQSAVRYKISLKLIRLGEGTLPNGELLAVKRLSSLSNQGIEGFKTEARLLAKLQHKKLIKLYGFCVDGAERLLVYDLLPNKSLDRFLADQNKASNLNWESRYKIILGVARGLHYLHEDSRNGDAEDGRSKRGQYDGPDADLAAMFERDVLYSTPGVRYYVVAGLTEAKRNLE